MNVQERKSWESFLNESLERKDESAGVTGIRAELCSQILNMSKKELFEFCQELESIPGLLNKPGLAMDCRACKKEFGSCTGQFGDVNLSICEERFWNCVERRASGNALNK